MSELTIKELNKILSNLIKDGHGDKEFQIYYDSDCVYTTIPKKSRIYIFDNDIRFSDYEEPDLPENKTIEKILAENTEDNIVQIILNKRNRLIEDYDRAVRAGMPTGAIIGEIDIVEEILEEINVVVED